MDTTPGRHEGTLSSHGMTGYDQFMNIVLDNTVEIVSPTEKNEIGMVVIRGLWDQCQLPKHPNSACLPFMLLAHCETSANRLGLRILVSVRGNSIMMWECLDRVK